MDTTSDPAARLDHLRQAIYHQGLGRRKDTLTDLLDAVLVAPGPATLARLTIPAVFRRRWSSAPDALAEGTLDEAACRRICLAHLPDPPPEQRPIWALDGTVWARPAAGTSPERTWGYRPLPGIPQEGLVPGWEYQWLVAVPRPGSSWVLPLDVARRSPTAGGPSALAISQLTRVLATLPPETPRPVVTCDSNYDPLALARRANHPDPAQRLAVDYLVRLSPRRCFWTPPPPYPGTGRPRSYGEKVSLWKPETVGAPAVSTSTVDPAHGTVRVELWHQMRKRGAADAPLTLVRITVDRLPRSTRQPKPMWLAWIGKQLPDDLLELWRWYALRFTVEQGFRFLKQDLGWTQVRLRAPDAGERWTWLVWLVLWQLWLARGLVADQRLPWERPLAPERLTPGRVRRAMGPILARLGTPARAVVPRGNSSGRAPGETPGPAPRYAVHYRRPKLPKQAA